MLRRVSSTACAQKLVRRDASQRPAFRVCGYPRLTERKASLGRKNTRLAKRVARKIEYLVRCGLRGEKSNRLKPIKKQIDLRVKSNLIKGSLVCKTSVLRNSTAVQYITHHTPLNKHHSSYTTHHTSLIIHHSSHTTHHTPLIIHHSSYTTHHTPLIIHHSSYTTHHTPLIMHHPSYTTHHTPVIIHHSSYTTHHTPLIIHHSSYTTHHTPLIIHHSSYTTHHALLIIQFALAPVSSSINSFSSS